MGPSAAVAAPSRRQRRCSAVHGTVFALNGWGALGGLPGLAAAGAEMQHSGARGGCACLFAFSGPGLALKRTAER